MKKFNALFFILMLTASFAFGQIAVSPENLSRQIVSETAISTNSPIFKIGTPAQHALNPSGAENSIAIDMDYDSLANNATARFYWNIHRDFRGNGMLSSLRLVCDTLHDVNTNTGYSQADYYQRIDSFTTFIRIDKFSDTTEFDTLIFTITELTSINDSAWDQIPVWADTLITNRPFIGANRSFPGIRLYPNVVFCNGPFAINVEFSGPIEDSLHLLAGYHRGMCTGALRCGAEKPSSVTNNTQYVTWNGGNRVNSQNSFLYFDSCPKPNGSGNGQRDTCEYYPLSDLYLFPSLTLIDKPLQYTKASTPDNGTANGTAGITVPDDIDFSIIWQSLDNTNSNLPQDVINQTNLNADRLLIGITIIGFGGCDGIIDTIVVGSGAAAIDGLLNAGISSLNAFPNPNNGTFNLEMSLKNMSDLTIKVLDLNGREIYRRQEQAVSEYNQAINLGDINAGIYYLEVQTELGAASTRIVIR